MTNVPRLQVNNILFVFIDLQKKLLDQIEAAKKIVDRSGTLLSAAEVLEIPAIVTTQYRKGLGDLDPKIEAKVKWGGILDKTTFSCGADPGFQRALAEHTKEWVAIAGVETHICVLQTALDLIQQGKKVAIVTDVVGARGEEDHKWGLDRMTNAGALPVTCEMLIYELLGRSDVPEFKKILPLIKGT
jgi:nicotinamidase-related amidase